jgi:choline kinase
VTDEKKSYDADDMKVIVDQGRLRRVSKRLDPATVNGESIGMMAFTGEGSRLFRDRLDYLMRHGEGTKQWYLSAIDEIAQQHQVGVCPIRGLSWCEIDDQQDLENAERVVRRWRRHAAAQAH